MNYLDATAEFYELDEITQKEFIEELRTAETSAALQIEEALYQTKTQTLGIDYTLNDFFVF